MKRSLIAGASLLAALAVSGCAGVQIDNFTNGAAPDAGYIVNRPVQYVAVADVVNEAGVITGQSFTPIVFPNPREGSAITLQRGLGSGSIELQIADGWRLAGLNAETDSQTDEFVTAVGGALANGRPPANGRPAGSVAPGIYRVIFNDQGHATAFEAVPFR